MERELPGHHRVLEDLPEFLLQAAPKEMMPSDSIISKILNINIKH